MCVWGGGYTLLKKVCSWWWVSIHCYQDGEEKIFTIYIQVSVSVYVWNISCVFIYIFIVIFQCFNAWNESCEISLWFNIKTTFKCKIHFWLKLQENPLSCFYSVVYEICCLEKTKLKKIQTFYGQNALLYYSAYSSCHLLLISFY